MEFILFLQFVLTGAVRAGTVSVGAKVIVLMQGAALYKGV